MPQIEITTGYRPGLIGVVSRHFSQNFWAHCGFGAAFEMRVARELADFVERIGAPNLQVWVAHRGEDVLGSIFIDGDNLGDHKGHLRWFILDPETRGQGIGDKLMTRAMAFCDARAFPETHLWTIKGTDAARKLYERHGFELAEEYDGDQWGSVATEQRFVRRSK